MLPPESGLPRVLGDLGLGSSGAAAASGPTDTQHPRQGPPSSLPAPRLYPPGACPAFAFFSGKSTLASAPRWPLSRSGRKVARAAPPVARKDGGGPAGRTCRCSETRPRRPRSARVLPLQPGCGWEAARGCEPRAKGPPREARRPVAASRPHSPARPPEEHALPRAPKLRPGSWGVAEPQRPARLAT